MVGFGNQHIAGYQRSRPFSIERRHLLKPKLRPLLASTAQAISKKPRLINGCGTQHPKRVLPGHVAVLKETSPSDAVRNQSKFKLLLRPGWSERHSPKQRGQTTVHVGQTRRGRLCRYPKIASQLAVWNHQTPTLSAPEIRFNASFERLKPTIRAGVFLHQGAAEVEQLILWERHLKNGKIRLHRENRSRDFLPCGSQISKIACMTCSAAHSSFAYNSVRRRATASSALAQNSALHGNSYIFSNMRTINHTSSSRKKARKTTQKAANPALRQAVQSVEEPE